MQHWRLSPGSLTYLRAIAIVLVGAHVLRWLASSSWEFGGDMNAYWEAAMRLKHAEPLFPPVANVNDHDVYRYSAWFAAAWIPATFLDKTFVTTLWVAIIGISAGCLVLLAARARTISSYLLAAILAPVLLQSAWYGQVQALLAVFLVWALAKPIGPLAIGVAASLKLTPILFVLVYLPNREWRKAGTALLVTVILSVPTLAFDLTNYPVQPGDTVSLASLSPWLWGAFAILVVTMAGIVSLKWPRFAGVAAGAATALAGPRVYVDYATYLVPSISGRRP
jgi:hypothetical protein